MNILFLIGNGFDINLGLKTGYPQFLKWYLDQNADSDSEIVKSLKANMLESRNRGDKYWSDLEFAMGDYTKNFKSPEDMEVAYDDLNENLRKYITEIEDGGLGFNPDNQHYRNNIIAPEQFLPTARRMDLRTYYGKFSASVLYINIVSFNYTKNVERLLGCEGKTQIGTWLAPSNSRYSATLDKIVHIHGCCDQPIMGVNDKSQISNPEFADSIDVNDYLIKPRMNENVGSMVHEGVISLIQDAQLVCIFGLSFGKTDKCWWKELKDFILKDRRVLLFVHDKNVNDIVQPRKVGALQRLHKQSFVDACGFSEDQYDYARDRIFVAINAPIFNKKEA